MLVLVGGIIIYNKLNNIPVGKDNLSFILGLFLLTLSILLFVIRSHMVYKCPKCEKVIIDGYGVPVNPDSCPHCDAPLK